MNRQANTMAILADVLRFRKTSLSLFTVIAFVLSIVIHFLSTHIALTPPSPEPSLLSQSWTHLQTISSNFHPFTSHDNDKVHDYLLDTVNSLSSKSYITSSIDKHENCTILINQHDVFDPNNDANRIIYYESSNILVKIEGSDSNLPGLLLSAHYDSVPTSFGTTDDGMGTVTLLSLLHHFSDPETTQPLRTIVLNFNNDEEFGLLGAEAFVKHKWFDNVEFFINLEGTGAGGCPILFRGTDKSVIDWYKYAPIPFATSIFQQGFHSGLIRSQTDYHVYSGNGMRGIDVAFYKPRSLYHTIRDSISGTTKGALWMMIKNVVDVVDGVANSNDEFNNYNDAVYFDILNHWFFSFSLNQLFVFNILLLVIVPIFNLILLLIIIKKGTWFVDSKGWLRLPIAITTSYYATKFCAKYFYFNDPLLLSNDYISPLLSLTSLTILISYIFLNFSSWLRPVHDQKLIILLELNFLFWCLLVWITVEINNTRNQGGFILTLFYVLNSVACAFGLLSLVFKSSPKYRPQMIAKSYNSTNPEGNSSSEGGEHEEIEGNSETVLNGDDIQNETSPLINNNESLIVINHESEETYFSNLKKTALLSFGLDWSIQFLTIVPLSIFFTYTNGDLILQALHQTIQESKLFDSVVINFLLLTTAGLSIPLMPFAHKLNWLTVQFFVAIFIIFSLVSYFESPISFENPLKLRFVEYVSYNKPAASIYGREGYIKPVLEQIPSIKYSNTSIECIQYNETGTESCTYEAVRPWLLDGSMVDNSFNNYLNVSILSNSNDNKLKDKYAPLEALLQIDISEGRQCSMTFNSTSSKSPVKMITVFHDANNRNESNKEPIPNGFSKDAYGNYRYKILSGIDELQLHKLDWNKRGFLVKIQWLPFSYDDSEPSYNLGVNTNCYWGEYDDVVVDGSIKRRKVAAFDELLQYSPDGIVWSNLRAGIVEVDNYVEL